MADGTIDEIIENDYNLTPSRYVGLDIKFDDKLDYKTRLSEIQNELEVLNIEAISLSKIISNNVKDLI